MSPAPLVVRPPAVAGTFYPADRTALRAALQHAFRRAARPRLDAPAPSAIVVPHAGYVYSGPVAASAYVRVEPARAAIRRVVLLGPSHRVPFRGLALSSAEAWATPLGYVAIDTAAAGKLRDFPWVGVSDLAHRPEHSLEVQLPFLQTVLDDFALVPLVVGAASTDEVAAVIDTLWTGADTLLIVSTDLSHYYAYDDAVRLDARTAAAIAARRPDDIADDDACGARPLRGLLQIADQRHLSIEELDVRNSGDTAGDKHSVVGYGSFAVA